MENYADLELWLESLNYMIMSARGNLKWLMENVTIEREDSWRDAKFNEIRTQIDMWVAEREICLSEMSKSNG